MEKERALADRRVLGSYLVAFLRGAQCHSAHMFGCRNTGGPVCRSSFYKQEFDWDVHVGSACSPCYRRSDIRDFIAFFRESRQGLRFFGQNAALDEPPG